MGKGKGRQDGFGPEEEDYVSRAMEKNGKRYFIKRNMLQKQKKRMPFNPTGKVKMNYSKTQ